MTRNNAKTPENLSDADLDEADGGLIFNLSVGLKSPPAGQADHGFSDVGQKLQYSIKLDR